METAGDQYLVSRRRFSVEGRGHRGSLPGKYPAERHHVPETNTARRSSCPYEPQRRRASEERCLLVHVQDSIAICIRRKKHCQYTGDACGSPTLQRRTESTL